MSLTAWVSANEVAFATLLLRKNSKRIISSAATVSYQSATRTFNSPSTYSLVSSPSINRRLIDSVDGRIRRLRAYRDLYLRFLMNRDLIC